MNPAIHQILIKHSIVDYLQKHGHSPTKHLSDGRLQYLCPFPDHNETKPSFVVWTNAEYENFHCFGCQRGYHILHLVSELEGIEYKEALKRYSIDISAEDEIRGNLEIVDKQTQTPFQILGISEILMEISRVCRMYLKSVNYDKGECEYIDDLFLKIDKSIKDYDFEFVKEVNKGLQDFRKDLCNRRLKIKAEKLRKRVK